MYLILLVNRLIYENKKKYKNIINNCINITFIFLKALIN